MVTKAKLTGGLGVINLRALNETLLMKNLHKFFNMEELPLVKLIWANYYGNGHAPSMTKKDHFGGRTTYNYLIVIKELSKLLQGKGISFGKICGMERYYVRLIPIFFRLQPMKQSHYKLCWS
jgi:hypothetical protein